MDGKKTIMKAPYNTGLVYPLSVVRRTERSKFTMKDCFSFEEQRAIVLRKVTANGFFIQMKILLFIYSHFKYLLFTMV